MPRPGRFPAGYEKTAVYLPGALLDVLDTQSARWTIGPNKIIEIATKAAVLALEGLEPGKRLPPIPTDSLNAAVASAMMDAMEPVRTVPKPNTISSIDGEDMPEGPTPDYPEADAPMVDGSRPDCDPATKLLLDTE